MLLLWISLLALVAIRVYYILPSRPLPTKVRRKGTDKCSFAVFLGSGGHTAEALTLVSALDFQRYAPRTYVISEGDTLSAQKAVEFEKSKSSINDGQYRIITIPRARRVYQPLLTTPPTALLSLLSCIYHVTLAPTFVGRPLFADLLLLNGPGTCVVLCVAVYVNKFFGLSAPRVIYVESFARVERLSLSGRLLRPFVDRFLVQWRQLLRPGGCEEYYGHLI